MLLLHVAFIVAILSGIIAFGHGFGDVVYLFLSVFMCLLFASFYPYLGSGSFGKWHLPLSILITVSFILLCLKATVFRGPEYSWKNHGIFYYN
jgi:hypothetical protein